MQNRVVQKREAWPHSTHDRGALEAPDTLANSKQNWQFVKRLDYHANGNNTMPGAGFRPISAAAVPGAQVAENTSNAVAPIPPAAYANNVVGLTGQFCIRALPPEVCIHTAMQPWL